MGWATKGCSTSLGKTEIQYDRARHDARRIACGLCCCEDLDGQIHQLATDAHVAEQQVVNHCLVKHGRLDLLGGI